MKNEVLKLVDSYWKFDESQQPMSSWHDKQDLLKALEELFREDSSNTEKNDRMPEWLTDSVRSNVKATWNAHIFGEDSKRIEAMRIVQKAAQEADYNIGIKKATELLYKYCLNS